MQPVAQPVCGCGAAPDGDGLIDIDTALARVQAALRPIPRTAVVGLAGARGRVLARPVHACTMTPPFDNAAMDGYAIDTKALTGQGPWVLSVVGRVAAGQAEGPAVTRFTAARIFTGAPIPAGADAVVMQEAVLRRGDSICLGAAPAPGQHIRRAGEDMQAGATILPAGRRIGMAEVAACAAAGKAAVQVRQRLRVGLLVTGNEVRRPEDEPAGVKVGAGAGAKAGVGLAAGQIWDVNTPMLIAALADPAVDLVTVQHAEDDRDALQGQLAGLSGTLDLIVTTGGLSVGEEDHVRPALAALGAETLFAGVAMKPGKPVSLGRIGGATWLGLPGNPLSAFVTWQVFGTAVLRALAGLSGDLAPRRRVVTATEIRRKPGRCELRPARLIGLDRTGRQIAGFDPDIHSGRVAGLSGGDGLIHIPAGAAHLAAGTPVDFQPLHD